MSLKSLLERVQRGESVPPAEAVRMLSDDSGVTISDDLVAEVSQHDGPPAAAVMHELFFADGDVKVDGDGADDLVWKVVLRTGKWKLRPGSGGVVRKPMRVVRDKPKGDDISLSEILKSFDDGAIEHVTVPLSHNDGPDENTGYVKALKIEDLADDKGSLLWAGINFTEPDIRGKAERGSIANCSSGVLFGFEHKQTKKKFSQVLAHVALTNKPWLNGMQPFGSSVAASDETASVVSLEFADAVVAPDKPKTGSVVWSPQQGSGWIRSQANNWLRAYRRAQARGRIDYDPPYDTCSDADSGSKKLLITRGYGDEQQAFISTFDVSDDGTFSMQSPDEWVAAKQEWVALSQVTEPAAKFDDKKGEQRARPANPIPTTGGRMRLQEALDAGIELSDDQKAAWKARDDESDRAESAKDQQIADLLRNDRESAVGTQLSQLDDTALDTPGIKKFLRNVFLSDTKPDTALMLSDFTDDGRQIGDAVAASPAQLFTTFLSLLPKDEEGKLSLSAQVTRQPGDDDRRPSVKGDDKYSQEGAADRARNLEQELELPWATKPAKAAA